MASAGVFCFGAGSLITGCGRALDRGPQEKQAVEGIPAPRPPIDLVGPGRVETATFALG
jgi:hypothetical protein